jgi:3-deoxy-7-phosphoheptulonate synthase
LHLEATADDVTECVLNLATLESAEPELYTSLCDPRLNPRQATTVANIWRGIAR